jgi:hypothetical protein
MRTLCARLALLCFLCSGFPGFSQALSPVPADGFQFTGTWDWSGTFRGGKVHKARFIGTVILAGKWLELNEQDTEPDTGYLAKYLIGYDPGQKQLVEFDANNFGAATYSSDQGWKTGVLTMTSPISSDPKASYAANRFTYSVTGVDSFTVDWQISKTQDLNWTQADHLACKRSKS